MMDLLTMQAPAARRALGRTLLRHTGNLPVDGPNSEEACTGLGRPSVDYISCYAMKKSRSHNSMAQTTESVLEPEDGSYVITSAPDNTYCIIDTDSEGDAESACCEKCGGSEETSCFCTRTAPPMQLHHSASSSTALSSAPSGFSSPSPPALVASGLTCDCDTGRCQRLSVQGLTGLGGIPVQLSVEQQQQLPDRSTPALVAAAGARGMVTIAETEFGTDLMGAFGTMTTDQWATFQAAVSGRPAITDAEHRTATNPAAADITLIGVLTSLPHATQTQQEQPTIPWQHGAAKADVVDRHSAARLAMPSQSESSGQVTTSEAHAPVSAGDHGSSNNCNPTATIVNAAAAMDSGTKANGDRNCDTEAVHGTSPGGSASSIASLMAAVNSLASAAVYDSTDDNTQAWQMLERCRDWSNAIKSTGVPSPVVTPSSTTAGSSGTFRHHGHRPRVHATTARSEHEYLYHQHQCPRDQRREMSLAARYTPHAEVPVPHPALAGPRETDDRGDGAVSVPGSPATRAASFSADMGRGEACTAVRNHLLQDCKGQGLQPSRGADMGSSGRTNSSFDGGYSYGQLNGSVYGGSYSRVAAQARSSAHSRFSVDLHHSARQPYIQPQQQPQQPQQYNQLHAAAAAGAHSQVPGSPSRRRWAGTLGLQPQSTSYTTYGYRRACSSLAALEQPAGAVVIGGCGSSSDDEDESELEGTRLITAFRTHTVMMGRSSGWGLLGTDSTPATPGAEPARRDHWAMASAAGNAAGGSGLGTNSSAYNGGGVSGTGVSSMEGGSGGGGGDMSGADKAQEGGTDGSSEDTGDALVTRKRSSYHLTNSHAAVELFLRLNHARQTMDFVKRQTQMFANLDKAKMTVWEALQTLNELREYEAVLTAEGGEAQEISELSLLDHAFQTAELCRLHHPDLDWLHLVGLMHGLGKLLAHRRFGTQPQWAICGETYPLGCRFSPHILGSQYFTANPDRRRRLFNTPTGLYEPGCGLLNVVMSWSAPEYLYLLLTLNRALLPQDALWILRHAKFLSLTRPHSCYLPLCSGDDLRRLPLLRSFQSLAAYRRVDLPEGFALVGEARTAYYSELIARYVGEGPIHW